MRGRVVPRAFRHLSAQAVSAGPPTDTQSWASQRPSRRQSRLPSAQGPANEPFVLLASHCVVSPMVSHHHNLLVT